MQLGALLKRVLQIQFVVQVVSSAFNINCNSNHASYYGQNSARNQKTLGSYCAD
ncbi:Chitinase 1, partial [Coemansia sp. S610]